MKVTLLNYICTKNMDQNETIKYFVEYWHDLWGGISSNKGLLTSFNPRVVIKELLEETTLKKNNNANKDFFKGIIRHYIDNDPGSNKRINYHLKKILKEFELSKHRPRYLPVLCESVLKRFEKLEYFEDCIESLIELVETNEFKTEDRLKIKLIVNHLIVEFREIGYIDKEIRVILSDVFYSEVSLSSGKPYWAYPHQIVCSDYESEEKIAQFKKELEDLQSKLTTKDRIKAFLIFAKKTKKPTRYIFQVTGMTGQKEIEIANTTFYSPAYKRFVIPDNKYDRKNTLELLGSNEKSINASVIVDTITPQSGELIARSKVERSLALCRRIMNGASSLRLIVPYLALDDAGRIILISNGETKRIKPFSINTDQQILSEKIQNIERARRIAESNGWGNKFNESCYWLKKAEETDSYIDKLLSYWICIETLCAKSENNNSNWFTTKHDQNETDIFLIKEIIGKLFAVGKSYEQAQIIYLYLSEIVNDKEYSQQKNVNLPNDLIKKAELDAQEGQRVLLKNLVNCSEEIKDNLQEGLLKEQIEELNRFYSKRDFALKELKKHLQNTKDELTLIYRMRNKIAHDGNSEHSMLPSLCDFANKYANILFNQIVKKITKENESELSSILMLFVQDYDLIESRLEHEDPIDIFM